MGKEKRGIPSLIARRKFQQLMYMHRYTYTDTTDLANVKITRSALHSLGDNKQPATIVMTTRHSHSAAGPNEHHAQSPWQLVAQDQITPTEQGIDRAISVDNM